MINSNQNENNSQQNENNSQQDVNNSQQNVNRQQVQVTLFMAVHEGAQILKNEQIENAEYDSFTLMESINGMDRTYYFMHGNDVIDPSVYLDFMNKIKQRASHVPLQHILGKTYFYGYEFLVNEKVLVPRPETELLVEEVLNVTSESSAVLDMCTGSGCIILSVALQNHIALGMGADLSTDALEVARHNQERLGAQNVALIESNLFECIPKPGEQAGMGSGVYYSGFDVIVSNPPYIRTDVIPTLTAEVRLHDPMMALDGFEDGLYFYREISKMAPDYLKQGGWLMFEIGYDQAQDVLEIMQNAGFCDICTIKDYSGMDRVVKGRL